MSVGIHVPRYLPASLKLGYGKADNARYVKGALPVNICRYCVLQNSYFCRIGSICVRWSPGSTRFVQKNV
jgi:hypothetical protein